MRLAFFGTPAFAVPSLRALVQAGHDVALVVAQPDRPSGRGQALQSPPTIVLARELGLPILQPLKVKTGELPEALEALGLDIAVVVAYGRILTPRLLAAPLRGCVNVHASLLPRWRGAAPIQWSILAGDQQTGVTTMQMAEGLDTGDMLRVEATPIGPEETAGSLASRLAEMGAHLLIETLAAHFEPVPQDSASVTWAPMLTKDQGWMDWARPARALDWQVRGLSPWPGTFTLFRGEPLKVVRARVVLGREVPSPGAPGTLGSGAVVACGEGALELLEVQLPGKKAVRGVDFVNGCRVQAGERLG